MLRRRLRYWFGRRQREALLRAEMEAHLEEMRAEGVSDSEARRRFGRMAEKQESSREVWIARWFWDFVQDARFGVRTILKQPGFAAVAVLSAALGIGACATVFSMLNFALLRPLPVTEPERLMSIVGMHLDSGSTGQSLAYPEMIDLRAGRSWEGVAGYAPLLSAGIRTGGAARRYWGFLVTGNYFDVVKPGFAVGRGFVDGEDDVVGAAPKVVLGYRLWRYGFGGDAAIVGRSVELNGRSFTVAGVTRAGFAGTVTGVPADFYLPVSQISEMDKDWGAGRLKEYGSQWLMGLGRLRAGVTLEAARAELLALAREVRERAPEMARDHAVFAEPANLLVQPLRSVATTAFLLLLGVTALVLLTACANVANLMLARASARQPEIAMRLALGASRGRLVRQLIAESLILGLAGGVAGIALVEVASRYIAAFRLPLPIPIELAPPTDHRVVLFCAALAVLTGVAFGIVPALRASGQNLRGSMRRFGVRNGLVVGQVAISTLLLICSGLFLRSVSAANQVDLGMEARNVLLVRFDPSMGGRNGPATRQTLLDVVRSVEAIPWVRSASVVDFLPLSLGGNFTQTRARRDGIGGRTAEMIVGPGYFATMGIRLMEGRDFRATGSREPVAIVNQALAERLFPGEDALGRELFRGDRSARIVGVAANTKYQVVLERDVVPILYTPLLDVAAAGASLSRLGGATLVVRTEADPRVLTEAVHRTVVKQDPDMVVEDGGVMSDHVQESMILLRLPAALFGLCGAMGLAIASVGVYGVISFAVARRKREIGIRMALGARAGQVVRGVLGHGFGVALFGVALGVAAGLALARVAGSLVYGVSTSDPLTFVAVPLLMVAVALAATGLPARRAARVNPNETLRSE